MICAQMLGPSVLLVWRDRFNQKWLKGWTDWQQEAKKSTFNDLIDDSELLVSSDMFYSCSLSKDCSSCRGSVTGHLSIQLDLVLHEVKPPTDITNPDTSLTHVKLLTLRPGKRSYIKVLINPAQVAWLNTNDSTVKLTSLV